MPRQAKPWLRTAARAWYARIGGKQVRLCGEAEGHAEALRVFYRLKAGEAVKSSEKTAPRDITAADLFCRFLDAAQRDTSPRTYEYYRDRLVPLGKSLGRRKARDLKPLHVTAWLDAHPKWGQATRRAVIVSAKRAMIWGADQGYVPENQLKGLKRPKMPRRAVMTAAEQVKVLEAIKGPAIRDFVMALAETGARPGELAGATAADLSADGRRLTVRGKTGPRMIPLNEFAADLFRRLAAKNPAGPLLLNSRGTPWTRNGWRCVFRRLRAKTGVANATAYAMRHLFGTLAVERGVDSLDVAKLMGHSNVRMLMEHYYHANEEALRRAMERATRKDGD